MVLRAVAVSGGGSGGSGTVTEIDTDATLTGGPITTTGTIGLASIAATTVLGNSAASAAQPTALTKAQFTSLVNTFNSTLSGAVAASSGGSVNFLRADGTWAAPGGGGSGTVTSIVADATMIGGTITTTGTIGLASIAATTVLGNSAASAAQPTALTKAQFTSLVNTFNSTLSGAVSASSGGSVNYLRADGTWAAPAGSGSVTNVATDATLTGGPITTTGTIGLASIAATTVLGNSAASAAQPTALTKAQLTTLVNTFNSTLSGAVSASSGGTVNFLRADGNWSTPGGGGTVTSIVASAPLTGGTITTTGTLGINVFGASGTSHSTGAVPDPGSSAGTTRYLREDATWQTPAGGGAPATVVYTTTSTVQDINGISYSYYVDGSGAPSYNAGNVIASIVMTASSTTQNIRFRATVNYGLSLTGYGVHFGIWKGTSTLLSLNGSGASSLGTQLNNTSFEFIYTPGATTATTYNLLGFGGVSGQHVYVNGQTNGSAIAGSTVYSTLSGELINS